MFPSKGTKLPECMLLSYHVLANLAKWLNARLRTKWLWVRIPLLSLKLVELVEVSHFRARPQLLLLTLSEFKLINYVIYIKIFYNNIIIFYNNKIR